MGRKEGGSLFHQMLNALGLLENARRRRCGKPVANSYTTGKNYRTWLHYAAEYFKADGIRRLSEIGEQEIQRYADMLQTRGYAASTIHSYLAPVCKVTDVPMDRINIPVRCAADYKKGGKSASCDGGAPGRLNAMLGFRRAELCRLHGNDLVRRNGEVYIRLDRGKGGKAQLQKVLPYYRQAVECWFDGSDTLLFHRSDMSRGFDYHAQRRAMAQAALRYYTERLRTDSAYRIMLYKEIAAQWHLLNKRDRARLEPLSWFDRPYVLRGKNRTLAVRHGKPYILDRLALRAVSVLHLSHWRDNVTVQSYYFDRSAAEI